MDATKSRMFLAGTLMGIIYGCFAVVVFSSAYRWSLCSFSFIALVPAALGFLPLAFVDEAQVHLYRKAIFIPWVSLMGALLLSTGFKLDALSGVALICVPAVLLLGLVIWVVRGLQLWRASRRRRVWASVALMLLPFVAVDWEDRAFAGSQTIEIKRAAVVSAPAPAVRALAADFPRDLAASLWARDLPGRLAVAVSMGDMRVDALPGDRLHPRTLVRLTARYVDAPAYAYGQLCIDHLGGRIEERVLADLKGRAELSARGATERAP